MFDSVRHFIAKHIPFESVLTSNNSIFDRAPSKKVFFNPKFSDMNFVCFLAFLMVLGRSRSKVTSVSATPEQRQEVSHEEESGGSDVGDQEDGQRFPQESSQRMVWGFDENTRNTLTILSVRIIRSLILGVERSREFFRRYTQRQ